MAKDSFYWSELRRLTQGRSGLVSLKGPEIPDNMDDAERLRIARAKEHAYRTSEECNPFDDIVADVYTSLIGRLEKTERKKTRGTPKVIEEVKPAVEEDRGYPLLCQHVERCLSYYRKEDRTIEACIGCRSDFVLPKEAD